MDGVGGVVFHGSQLFLFFCLGLISMFFVFFPIINLQQKTNPKPRS